MLITACTIEEDEDRETPNEYKKKRKRMKEKHNVHKNNYMENWSAKQWVKKVKISGMGKKKVLEKNNWSLNNGRTRIGYKN